MYVLYCMITSPEGRIGMIGMIGMIGLGGEYGSMGVWEYGNGRGETLKNNYPRGMALLRGVIVVE